MFVEVFAVIGFVAVASGADLSVGAGGGKLIFEQNITASPAIWRQVKTLTVNATNTTDEFISRVVVIDNRPEKDGEAKVIEGGEGQKNVTLELKSPAVFRGLDFSIQVFANEGNVNARVPQQPKDLNANENQEPKDGSDIIIEVPKPTASSTTKTAKDDEQKINNPALVGKDEQTRLNRDTEDHKTEDHATVLTPVDVTTEVNENATKIGTEMEEHLKKALDTIFKSNSAQKDEDTQKVNPVMPQAESDDLAILRDEEENRKVRQASKELPALPKDLTKDDHTTAKSEVSSSSTEKNFGQEKNVPKVVTSDFSDVSSTTSSENLKTQFKQPENVKTKQDLEGAKGHHFGHHHAVPLPYVNN